MYTRFFKRGIDFLGALLGLIIISPILLVVGILLALTNRGTPFFTQRRPGKNERIFKLVKFKTMNDLRDKNGNLLPDEARLTKIGKVIRKSSLDELPQLMNVVKGDMSLIGPRPLLVEYLPLYSKEQARRHEVKPGITGWAQVNGRNAISWKQKFEYDLWYVDHLSLWIDLRIMLLSISKVLKQEGINLNDKVSMEPFKGYG